MTPLTRWERARKTATQDVLLIRVGDFYESFGEDAERLAKLLGIAIVKRIAAGKPLPMIGFPWNSMYTYLTKLEREGISVLFIDDTLYAPPEMCL